MVVEFPKEDIFVALERDVPAHHVIEQHSQGPDSGRHAMVPVVLYPLRRAVYPGACKNGKEPVKTYLKRRQRNQKQLPNPSQVAPSSPMLSRTTTIA